MTNFKDYTKQPRDSAYQFDQWKKDAPIATPMGNYECEFILDFDQLPDDQMSVLADKVASFLSSQSQQVGDILVAHLHRCAEDWGDEFVFEEDPIEGEPIPRNATGEQLFQAYGGGRIEINRYGDDDSPYQAIVSFSVPFDPEHGLQLDFVDGQIKRLNDSEFTIEDGRLKYEWD